MSSKPTDPGRFDNITGQGTHLTRDPSGVGQAAAAKTGSSVHRRGTSPGIIAAPPLPPTRNTDLRRPTPKNPAAAKALLKAQRHSRPPRSAAEHVGEVGVNDQLVAERAGIEAAIEELAARCRAYAVALKQVLDASYGEARAELAQAEVVRQFGMPKVYKGIVLRMRSIGLGRLLDYARTTK